MGEIFEFSRKKNRIYVKEPYQVYTCTDFQVHILKKCPSFNVLKLENDKLSPYFRRFLHFPILKIYPIWEFKSALASSFAFLTKN